MIEQRMIIFILMKNQILNIITVYSIVNIINSTDIIN